jgi:hypothetical protein
VAAPAAPEATDTEGWALLEAMRRKLDDHAVQQRKTITQVTQLADSVAALVAAQRRRSRWLNVNSFVAYLMFTVLCGIAFYFVYASHAHELAASRDRATTERDAAVQRADAATAKLAQREAADAAAAKQTDAASHSAHEAQAQAKDDDVIQAAFAGIKAGRFREVVGSVERALVDHPSGPHVAQLHYLAGVALAKLFETDAAIAHLEAAVDGDTIDDDVRFQLASQLDRAGQVGKARGEYDRFAVAHPQSAFAGFARQRSAMIGAAARADKADLGPRASDLGQTAPAVPAAPAPAAPVATETPAP